MLSFSPKPLISYSFHETKDCYMLHFQFSFYYESETLSSKFEERMEIEVV
jgi:hypothetical protein